MQSPAIAREVGHSIYVIMRGNAIISAPMELLRTCLVPSRRTFQAPQQYVGIT